MLDEENSRGEAPLRDELGSMGDVNFLAGTTIGPLCVRQRTAVAPNPLGLGRLYRGPLRTSRPRTHHHLCTIARSCPGAGRLPLERVRV